jgi:lysophospholipase L1-like esterase
LHKAIADSGAELVDLFPLFLRTERSANHPALFGTRDFHFSDQGKELVANAVGDAIEQLDPWKPSK